MFDKYNNIRSKADVASLTDTALIDLHIEVSNCESLEEYANKMDISISTLYAYKSVASKLPISFRNKLRRSLVTVNLFPFRVYTKEVTCFSYEVLACNELEARTKADKFYLEKRMGNTEKVDIVVDVNEIASLEDKHQDMLLVDSRSKNYK